MRKITALTLVKSFSPNKKIIVFSSEPKEVFHEVREFLYVNSYFGSVDLNNLEIMTSCRNIIRFYQFNDPHLNRLRGIRADTLLVEGSRKDVHDIEEIIMPFLSIRKEVLILEKIADAYGAEIEESWINEYKSELIFTDE